MYRDIPKAVFHCHTCQLENQHRSFFTPGHSWVGKPVLFCHRCAKAKEALFYQGYLGLKALLVIVGILYILIYPEREDGWRFINVGIFYACIVAATFPHELGHALMSSAVGCPVYHIVIGTGRNMFDLQALGYTWKIHQIPIGGGTLTGFQHTTTRFQKMWVYSAGGLVNLLLAGLTWALLDVDLLITHFGAPDHLYFLELFIIANILIALTALLPYQTKSLGQALNSDGMAMLIALLGKQDLSYELLESTFLLEDRRYEEAYTVCLDGLSKAPHHLSLQTNLTQAELMTGDYESAVNRCSKLLQREDLSGYQSALVHSYYAYGLLCQWLQHQTDDSEGISTDKKTTLQNALQHAQLAHEKYPDMPEFTRTLGAVHVVLDNLETGIPLLELSLNKTTEETDKGEALAFLGWAFAKTGAVEDSQSSYDQGKALNPDAQIWHLVTPENAAHLAIHVA